MHNFILSIAVEPRVVFTSRPLLPETKKDVLPALFLNYVVNNLSCHCDSRYASCTSQRLRDKFVNTCQNVLKLGKFRTLAILLLVLANLQPQSCLVNPQLVNTF